MRASRPSLRMPAILAIAAASTTLSLQLWANLLIAHALVHATTLSFSLMLLSIAVASYLRTRRGRHIFLSSAFAAYSTVQLITFLASLAPSHLGIPEILGDPVDHTFNLIILLFFILGLSRG